MKRSRTSLLSVSLISALLLFAAVACGSETSSSADTTETTATPTGASPEPTAPVVRDVLGDLVDPPGANGRVLTLARYTIAPGAQLAPHIHPGVQMAWIESGTLTYHVLEGTATVRWAGSDADEELAAPATVALEAGDTVIELGDMVHFGANETGEQVVIMAALLTEEGHELAEPVEVATGD